MKIKVIHIVIFFWVAATGYAQDMSCQEEAMQYRASQNADFKNSDESPLEPKDRDKFKELDFYEYNEDFCVKAKFTPAVDTSIFKMPTTTSRLPEYRKYGTLEFDIKGETYSLTVYENIQLITDPKYKNHLFLPFTDLTNGEESYAGGRYIDLEKPLEDFVTINFNNSYNPYCAYNKRYSCPLVPKENNLEVAITAGVRKYY